MNEMPDYTTIWLDAFQTPNRDWHARRDDAIGEPVEFIRTDIVEGWRDLASLHLKLLRLVVSDVELTAEQRREIRDVLKESAP